MEVLPDCPTNAIQILLLKPDGTTHLRSPETEREPEAGDTILYYAPKRQREATDAPAESATAQTVA